MLFLFWILQSSHFISATKPRDLADKPRITLTNKDGFFRKVSLGGEHSRVELLPGPSNTSIYVGCNHKLLLVDFQEKQPKEVPLKYNVTVLHDRGPSLFICGTDGHPLCFHVDKMTLENFTKSEVSVGVAPHSVGERAPSIFVGEELYSTANFHARGDGIGVRRSFGPIKSVWSTQNRTEQRYVALTLSGPRENRLQDRIYSFFMEKSSTSDPESEPWVPRVTQVCRVDQGGPKTMLQRCWTSLLKARLSCGVAEKKQYFKELLDIAVLHAESWMDSRVYALFTSSWGMTAVCVYTMASINHTFATSNFKGQVNVAHGRPGTCFQDSSKSPEEFLNIMKSEPELTEPVRSESGSAPLMVSAHPYTHVQVDRVHNADRKPQIVLLLSLEDGKIHKVLETSEGPFIIAELRPFPNQARASVRNMLVQSSTRKLYMSTSTDVLEVNLQDCRSYGEQCEDCVLARDPYCAWDPHENTCTGASSGQIQDVEQGQSSVCDKGKTEKYQSPQNHAEPSLSPASALVFLSCPVTSSHATYSWYHDNKELACIYTEDSCLLRIEDGTPKHKGVYMCKASENGYQKSVTLLELRADNGAVGLLALPFRTVSVLLLAVLLL